MSNKPTFLGHERPLITCMVQADNPDRAIELATLGNESGCDAFGFQFEVMPNEYRTEQTIRKIFDAMNGKPVYVTNYRSKQNTKKSDDELLEGLLFLCKCGATLMDIMGDFYCPHPNQLTEDPSAIVRQKEAIARIHDAGGEVLMSSHLPKCLPANEIMHIALAQQERGADIVKIVNGGNTEEEMLEHLRITTLLKKELRIPFLYLSGGPYATFHRTMGPMLGCCTWLTVAEHDQYSTKLQPICRDIRAIADHYKW